MHSSMFLVFSLLFSSPVSKLLLLQFRVHKNKTLLERAKSKAQGLQSGQEVFIMAEMGDNSGGDKQVFLSIDETPIYFREDWNTGIGGGLWSTGLAIAKYFEHHYSDVSDNLNRLAEMKRKRGENDGISAIELGSGNGFLSACLLALAQTTSLSLKNVVVTDMEDHLILMEKTIRTNPHVWDELIVTKEGSSSTYHGSPSNRKERPASSVTVAEYKWGVDDFNQK
eukprot:scaffold7294_cov109-Skeletonema_marinoi.AAC.3